MIQLTEQQLALIIKKAHKEGQGLIGYIDVRKAEEYASKIVGATSYSQRQICKTCNSNKSYDVFCNRWLCPICDNVKQ